MVISIKNLPLTNHQGLPQRTTLGRKTPSRICYLIYWMTRHPPKNFWHLKNGSRMIHTRNISNSSNSFGTQPPTHLFPHRKKQRHSGNIKNTFYRRHTGNATTIFAKFPNMQRSSFFLYLSGIILPLNRNRPYSHYLPHKYNISNLLHLYVQTVR